jgi:hypothetical protein
VLEKQLDEMHCLVERVATAPQFILLPCHISHIGWLRFSCHHLGAVCTGSTGITLFRQDPQRDAHQ